MHPAAQFNPRVVAGHEDRPGKLRDGRQVRIIAERNDDYPAGDVAPKSQRHFQNEPCDLHRLVLRDQFPWRELDRHVAVNVEKAVHICSLACAIG